MSGYAHRSPTWLPSWARPVYWWARRLPYRVPRMPPAEIDGDRIYSDHSRGPELYSRWVYVEENGRAGWRDPRPMRWWWLVRYDPSQHRVLTWRSREWWRVALVYPLQRACWRAGFMVGVDGSAEFAMRWPGLWEK